MKLLSMNIVNFKAFKKFKVKFKDMNIMIGNNNSGKTTIISALRLLAVALEHGKKKKPNIRKYDRWNKVYDIPKSKLPIPLENIQNDYHENDDSYIEFTFENNAVLRLFFPDIGECSFVTDIDGYEVHNKSNFCKYFSATAIQIPILGPLEDEEKMLKDDTIAKGVGTQRASRHFRNQWHRDEDKFDYFAKLIRDTWAGMEINKPEHNMLDNRIVMFCEEERITREVYWIGYGFQIWCQLLSYIAKSDDATLLIVDEPDIYLHPDLQKKFIKLVRDLDCQIILATHSIAILNEAKVNEVLFIDKTKSSSKRLKFDEFKHGARLNNEELFNLIVENEGLIKEVINSEVRNEDLVTIGYRKKQLEIFGKLLDDSEFFNKQKKKNSDSAERVWQTFFEKNAWIFGYGLGFVFLSNLEGKKLEQVVKGFDLNSYGKRADGVMKSMGAISNLCFIEIKTHETMLLDKNQYRGGCWSQSKELTGGVAQVRITVDEAVKTLSEDLRIKDDEGNPTGEILYNYKPKSYLVIGSLEQLNTTHGVNKSKLRSFELYRKNQSDIEIITFDELYERARFIVYNNQQVNN